MFEQSSEFCKVVGVIYICVGSEYFEKWMLKWLVGVWGLWGFVVVVVIFGDFFGWNFGIDFVGFGGMFIVFVIFVFMYYGMIFVIGEMVVMMLYIGGVYLFV